MSHLLMNLSQQAGSKNLGTIASARRKMARSEGSEKAVPPLSRHRDPELLLLLLAYTIKRSTKVNRGAEITPTNTSWNLMAKSQLSIVCDDLSVTICWSIIHISSQRLCFKPNFSGLFMLLRGVLDKKRLAIVTVYYQFGAVTSIVYNGADVITCTP
jgi:hypothetical protein